MSQEKRTSRIESTSEKDPKQVLKLWVLKPSCQNYHWRKISLISGSAPDFFHSYFEWGPTLGGDGRWECLPWQQPPLKFSPGTDSSGSCSPMGWVTGVSQIIPSYPAGIPSDPVQPKSKPASPHLQCHHTSQGRATSQGWHLTPLLLTLITCNNHFYTTSSKPALRI